MKNYSSRGFTLIELLISISLLSLVMTLATWSFSIFINNWEGRLGYFSKHVSGSKDLVILHDALSTIRPYIVKSKNSAAYYYKSSANKIEAIASYGIFVTDEPVIFKLSKERDQNGSFYLLYQEVALLEVSNIQVPEYRFEKILVENIDSAGFSVYAWPSLRDKIIADDPLSGSEIKPKWHDVYNASDTDILPLKLRIVIDDFNFDILLSNDYGQMLNKFIQNNNDDE